MPQGLDRNRYFTFLAENLKTSFTDCEKERKLSKIPDDLISIELLFYFKIYVSNQ